jgi:hypothetical protein
MYQIDDYGDMENTSRPEETALSKLTDACSVGCNERDASVSDSERDTSVSDEFTTHEFRTNTVGDIKSGTNN